jgi:hypothetical protein
MDIFLQNRHWSAGCLNQTGLSCLKVRNRNSCSKISDAPKLASNGYQFNSSTKNAEDERGANPGKPVLCDWAGHFQKRLCIRSAYLLAQERAKSKKHVIFAFMKTFSDIGPLFGSLK